MKRFIHGDSPEIVVLFAGNTDHTEFVFLPLDLTLADVDTCRGDESLVVRTWAGDGM